MDADTWPVVDSQERLHEDSRRESVCEDGSLPDESSTLPWSHLVEERWSLDSIAAIAEQIPFPVDILLSKSCHQLCFVNDFLPCAPLALKLDQLYRTTVLRYVPFDVALHSIPPNKSLVFDSCLVSWDSQIRFASNVSVCAHQGHKMFPLAAITSANSLKRDQMVAKAAHTWLQRYLMDDSLDPTMAHLCDSLLKRKPLDLGDEAREFLTSVVYPPTCLSVEPIGWNSVSFVSSATFESNSPIEDRHVVLFDKSSECILGMVLDGHGGTACVDQMLRWLPQLISYRLDYLVKQKVLSPSTIGFAMMGSFLECEARWLDSIRQLSQQCAQQFHQAKHILDEIVATAVESSSDSCSNFNVQQERLEVIHDMYNKSIDMGASGTCALAFVVGPDYLVLGNAGDCRAMLIDASTRECNWITTPHTPYEREEFNRVVTLVQGRDSMPIRPCSADLVLAMSRKIGTKWFDNYALERILSDSTKISQTFDTYNDSLALLEPVFLLQRDIMGLMTRRVAGVLTVTRALGDAYLKDRWFAPTHLKPYVPYIHATPEITIVKASHPDNRPIMVVASDGVWDELDLDQVADIIMNAEPNTNVARLILNACLQNAADRLDVFVDDLCAISPGPQRRKLFDDMTVVVLWLGHAPMTASLSSNEIE